MNLWWPSSKVTVTERAGIEATVAWTGRTLRCEAALEKFFYALVVGRPRPRR